VLELNKLLQGLGIPFAAFISVIFGLMIISFPVGTYVFFNSTIESDINFDYPLNEIDFFSTENAFKFPVDLELGDAFIVIWSVFVVLFTIAMFGPKTNFLRSVIPIMMEGKGESKSNYLVTAIKWFCILIVVSSIIIFVQDSFGIKTEAPESPNVLIQFFNVTLAPITEEIGFRVLLIGIPLYAMYTQKSSIRKFFKSLWHPSEFIYGNQLKRVIILITVIGIFFGIAHIISGEPWSLGKFAQATASGIIIGWVYFRHGLISAILIHWATNYFIFSYVYLIADINEFSIQNAFSHSLTHTMEILFVITGVISIAMMIINYVKLKKEKKLEI
jgi:hypothetical protein